MSDWDREELDPEDDSDRSFRPPAEGVRIIGAEEAAAALEAGQAAGRRPDDELKYGDVPPAPEGPRPAVRFPLPESVDPSEIAPRPPLVTPPAPATPSMPHWTEPPTGEIPKVLAGEEPPAESDDDLAAWSALSRQPRWRDEHSSWDEFDDASVLADDDTRLGALDSSRAEHSDVFDFDAEPEPVRPRAEETRQVPPTRVGTATRRAPRRPAIGAEPPDPNDPVFGGGGGRDVNAAVATGLGVGVLALILFKLGPGWTMWLVTAIVTLAAVELFDVLRRAGYQPATLLGLAATVSALYATYEKGEKALPLVLFLTTAFAFLWYLFGVVRAKPTTNVAVTVLGFVWVGFFGSYAALMLSDQGLGGQGLVLLITTILATVASDVGAYAVGSQMGSRPLAPEISPNKTVEGVIGGVVTSVVVTMLVVGYIATPELWTADASALGRADLFIFSLVIGLVAPLGDLIESHMKRDLGIKDTGALLPGHGGVLDRFDAMLFTLPTAYYLVQILV